MLALDVWETTGKISVISGNWAEPGEWGTHDYLQAAVKVQVGKCSLQVCVSKAFNVQGHKYDILTCAQASLYFCMYEWEICLMIPTLKETSGDKSRMVILLFTGSY